MKKLGWHFARVDNCLNYSDKRPIIIGKTHTIDTTKKPMELCKWGLHAASKIIDALRYAPGPMIYRVELSGEIITGDDKMCATKRTYLWGYDATDILFAYARRCALDVIHLWDAKQVVIDYLKTGDHSLSDEAWNALFRAEASWSPVEIAARYAARYVFHHQAEVAANNAGWEATRATAAAANAGEWIETQADARKRQNNRLAQMIIKGRKS